MYDASSAMRSRPHGHLPADESNVDRFHTVPAAETGGRDSECCRPRLTTGNKKKKKKKKKRIHAFKELG